MDPSETFTLSERLAMILDGLCKAVAARIAPGMAGWAMTAPMILLVWKRIRRSEQQVQALLRRFREGRLWTCKVARVGVSRERRAVAAVPSGLPQRFGWLMAWVPYQAAGYASQLRVQLSDPEMIALLTAAPQARRALRPVCRMLGIEAILLNPAGVTPELAALAPPDEPLEEGDAPCPALPEIMASAALPSRAESPLRRSRGRSRLWPRAPDGRRWD